MKKAVALLTLCVVAVLVGCSQPKEKYGQDISHQKPTPISAVLADAKGYEGKNVVIDGKITLECPTGCWFDITDETATLYVDIASGGGFSIPQKVGSRVLVEGEVGVRESGLPYLLGKGVEFK